MITSRRRRQLGLATIVLGWACTAWPAAVRVTVATKAQQPIGNAIVVFDPLDGMPAPGHDLAVIDQVDKRFVPQINVIRTGTSVIFPNSDQIRHQVYSFSPAKTFTIKLYARSPRVAELFDQPGLVVLGCNIHDNMSAFVLVVDTPYFFKVPASGTAQIELPAGHYRVRLWHPNLSLPFAAHDITVAGDVMNLPLVAELNTGYDFVAAWP